MSHLDWICLKCGQCMMWELTTHSTWKEEKCTNCGWDRKIDSCVC